MSPHRDRITGTQQILRPTAAAHDGRRTRLYLPFYRFTTSIFRFDDDRNVWISEDIAIDAGLERYDGLAIVRDIAVMTVCRPRDGEDRQDSDDGRLARRMRRAVAPARNRRVAHQPIITI